MVIKKFKDIAVPGRHGRPILTDVFFTEGSGLKPVVVFCHGYKGFKDWGVWNMLAEEFALKGFMFIKFNFAFNGIISGQPMDFTDLEAFGENTYTRELDDIEVLLDWIQSQDFPYREISEVSRISLMGHSRGGGISVIKASEDKRIGNLITLGAVSDFGDRFPKGPELSAWKEKGIAYIENKRTGQMMPHLYQFYTDFKDNEDRLTITKASRKINIPALIIHGTADPTVSVENAFDLKKWIPNSELFLLEGSDHVFEGKHPWVQENLPPAMYRIVQRVTEFLKNEE